MAKGLRIHHPTARSVVFLVPVPALRPDLGGIDTDIPIHLDENGDSIVSEGVWDELLRAKSSGYSDHEFVILNEIDNPPTIMMGPGLSGSQPMRTLREQQPGTMYESELQVIAQQFAPSGFKAQITTKSEENGK